MRYAWPMVMVQIRGVSTKAHRRLKARAALEGKSLSEYLRAELEELAELPTLEEMAERIAALPPVGGLSGAAAVSAARREREQQQKR
jgi:hypothetical protein